MDKGFIKAGYTVIFANDKNRDACNSYEKNLHFKPICEDIRKIEKFPTGDVVVGCNPCQGFSIIGPRNPEDPRNYLYKEILRCVLQVKPNFFVTENVKGLKSLYGGRFLKLILNDFQNAGYTVSWNLLNAKDFGVPQDRERIFMVGVRADLPFRFSFPKRTHGPGCLPYVSMREAIGDLPAPKKGEYWDDNRFSFYYLSRNRRRSWEETSFTIQASGRHSPLHPSSPPMKQVGKDKWILKGPIEKYRRLSIRECALIQTFEKSDEFAGNLHSQYLQIGNAVPPLLAQKIAEAVNVCIQNETEKLETSLNPLSIVG
jgi:DNA (cytosine-5)-methyltransferase 1